MISDNKWIWTPDWTEDDDSSARVVLMRKTFMLTACEVPTEARIRISADSRYKLFINSTFVCEGPAKGDAVVRYYDEIDIAPWLSEGENIITAEVLRYPEAERGRNLSLFRSEMPGLMIGGWVNTDNNWRCFTESSRRFVREEDRFAPLIIHEEVRADASLAGWKCSGYDDSKWCKAIIRADEEVPAILRNVQPRPIPMQRHEAWRGLINGTGTVTVAPHSNFTTVMDAGEEMCGYIRLAMSGGAGAEIELLYSECYQIPEDDRLIKGNRLDSENGVLEGYSDKYCAHGQGTAVDPEVYEPYWFRTFRFVKVTVRTGEEPLTIEDISYLETGYPLEVKTSVRTSDESLAGIWDISLRTLRRCMHETYMDCPYYEQLQYIMDTRSEVLYTYAVSADDRMARKAIYEFGRSQYPDGLLNCSYPSINRNIIPGFSIYYILMVHDHMMYFGDRQLINDQWPVIERILGFFDSHMTDNRLVDKIGGGVLNPVWSFIDWADEWQPEGVPLAGYHGPITMESLLYILGLDAAADLADYLADEALGKSSGPLYRELADGYREKAESVREAIRKFCLNDEGLITDGQGRPELSQHCQVFGILTGVYDTEKGKRALLRSMEDDNFAKCTVSMRFYLFRALEKTGLYELTDKCWNVWRDMIADGCTTSIESDTETRSECHAWGSLSLYELPSVVLGVRPAAPGYEKIEVRPVPGYLTSASGTVHTPKGDVSVSWTNDSGELKLNIDAEETIMHMITINETQAYTRAPL